MLKFLVILAVCCIQATFCADICPCGWTNVGGGCYKFVRESVRWDVARADCQKSGGDLVIVSDSEEDKLLVNEANRVGVIDPYLGYFRPRYQPDQFFSVCGVTPSYTNWWRTEPNDAGGKEGCVTMYTRGNRRGAWNDISCSSYHHYICEFNYNRCD